ncbi:ABC transporter permease [Sporichthya brevicatena]|uniref:ABC transporter permease n=1 Tax=Sporichthya brevicatena TaxID=171442 RepID=A0ABP3SF26_9ACTN
MNFSRRARALHWSGTAVTLAFIYFPLAIIALYAFNSSRVQRWPIDGLSTKWVDAALHNPGARDALLTSIKVALMATGVALVLGSLAAFAVARYNFFGRNTISFLVVIPIAMPGIVTGMALNSAFREAPLIGGVNLGLLTIVISHATFCIVLVYNNVIARLRRMSGHLEEASADLGAHPLQTFRYVTFPTIRSALLAGGLLAFALSFDEIIVTIFTAGSTQTLPIWILQNYSRPNQGPIVNAVGLFAILLSIIPVYLAQRLTEGEAVARGSTGAAAAAAK